MRFLLRLFSAFCVATVIAQLMILAMMAVRGNLHSQTMTKALALFNGIDITGVQLQKVFDNARNVPVPTYDDVLAQRAQQNLNLEMRERSVARYTEQLEAMQASLKQQQADFDRRKEAFYNLLDEMSKKGKEENLGEIQRTLESLSPELAKAYIIKMLDGGQMADVVAIIKGMSLDKRKKVIGEFSSEKEVTQFAEVINQLRLGEPTASIIDQARKGSQPASP